MRYTFVSLFENLISGYFSASILANSIKKNIIEVDYFNPRDYTKNKHKKVDDYMIGGGAGLLMSPQPLDDTLKDIQQKYQMPYFIFLSPSGKKFIQKDAKRLAKKEHIVFVCGRYEGIDERIVESYANEVFSTGDYVLTGGELPALCMCDAISRNIKDVLGNANSLDIESYENHLLEAPSFTKPNKFKQSLIPLEFLKGNHGKIATLKKEMSIFKTQFFRPDLYKKYIKDI